MGRILSRHAWLAAAIVSAAAFGSGAGLAQPAEPLLGSPQWFFNVVPALAPADLRTREAQQYLQALHMVGRHDVHAAYPERPIRAGDCRPYDGASEPVVERLVDLARATRIVIVNEAHDESRHRELIRELAIGLRSAGYSYYAAEAFSPAAEQRRDEPFGRADAGYYALEPTFGRLLRTVKELGFRLVAYEHSVARGDASDLLRGVLEREEGQANNLLQRIFNIDPEARALIHVGYSHAAEVALPTFGEDVEWLAARLKAKTGIDPLTIDQVRCAASGADAVLAHPSTDLPKGAHDVAVAHPATTLFRGRPQWRIDAGDIAIELPDALAGVDVRTLIEARYEAEPVDAIPLDRLLLSPGERLPLLLRPGRIRIVQHFEDGRAPVTLVLNVR